LAGTIINYNTAAFASSDEEKSVSKDGNSFVTVPNPASSKINISLTNYTGTVTIRLSNIQGKILQEKKLDTLITKFSRVTTCFR
jgi:hypothetical protein